MEWLSQWIAWLSVDGNWIPVATAGVLGLILGWLFTRMPARSRAREAEARISDLDSQLRKASRRADEAENQVSDLKRQLENVKSDLEKANAHISSLEEEVAAKDAELTDLNSALEETRSTLAEREDTIAALEPQLKTRESDLTNLQADTEALRDEHEQALSTLRAELDALTEQYQAALADIEALQADLAEATARGEGLVTEKEQLLQEMEGLKEEAGVNAQEAANKTAALDEAFLRSTRLQRQLEERETEYADALAELRELRREVAEVSMLKDDMEQKLNHARGDVASELAVLTSTMIKMKDDALKQANRRNAALAAELDALRASLTDTLTDNDA